MPDTPEAIPLSLNGLVVPEYPPTSRALAEALSPAAGLKRLQCIRPFGEIVNSADGPVMTGLDNNGLAVCHYMSNVPGFRDGDGGQLAFVHCRDEIEVGPRTGRPRYFWFGQRPEDSGRVPGWYILFDGLSMTTPEGLRPLSSGLGFIALNCIVDGPAGDAANPAFRELVGLPQLKPT